MLKSSDIVQIPFPFSDLTHQKRRPVLLLTTPDTFGDFLVAAITSQAGHDDAILLHDDDIVEGRLPKISWIRTTRLFSLNRDTVIVTLGSLKPEAFERIHKKTVRDLVVNLANKHLFIEQSRRVRCAYTFNVRH